MAREIVVEGQELTNLDALECLESVNSITAIDTALERVNLPSATFVGSAIFEDNLELREISLERAEDGWRIDLIANPQLLSFSAPVLDGDNYRLWSESNDQLVDLDLRSATHSSIVVRESPSLRSFDLSSLVEGGSIEFSDTGLRDTLDLSSLEATSSHIVFARNHDLREVRLDDLVEVGQELVFDENPSLDTIRLDHLENALRNILFRDNSSLREVRLPELSYLYGSLSISDNDSLRRVEVPALESVGDPDTVQYLRSSLSLTDNSQLADISFESLHAVGQRLQITGANGLRDLHGLSSLTIVRGNFVLSFNRMLQDITGLNGMESIGMAAAPIGPDAGNYLVRDNPRLPMEQAEALAFDIVGEDNIGGDVIILDVPFGGSF
ncbi:MAG: hypothetical protein CL928_04610 [Deltaproteobacteria bacterium]|nr:hypothetical protein [Deltaproteobacteria bacterium]